MDAWRDNQTDFGDVFMDTAFSMDVRHCCGWEGGG